MMTDHPPFDRLSALVDGDHAPDDAAVERHLAACAACRADLARLRALLDRAATLPPSIEPPTSAWSALRTTLWQQPTRVAARTDRMRTWGLRAAAALLLVAGSSGLTVLALRARAPAQLTVVPRSAAPTMPASVQAIERSYAGAVDELTATLRAQRGALAPATAATLERTLRVIDEAIAEARAALAADPANGALRDVLAANYEHKVQLLRRASELPART